MKPPGIDDVAAAAEQGRFDEALRAAVTVWQRHRDVGLADLIDAISARMAPAPIPGRDKEAFQRNWINRTANRFDPVSRTAPCEDLLRSIPLRKVDYFAKKRDIKTHQAFLDRIAALSEHQPDPRVAAALTDVIERGPFSVEDHEAIYGLVLELLVKLGDRRSAVRLRALDERPIAKTQGYRSYLEKTLPSVIEKIERAKPSPLRVADREIVARLLGALAAPAATPVRAGDLDSLLAECLASPDDDVPRSVYMDALLEADDPRGELIQLQLRASLGEPERKRIASLQRKYEKAWLGDITRVTKLRVFRRGFLDEAELLQGAVADEAMWWNIAADPRLATVRVLHKGSASEELYSSFVFSPAMESLRDIEVPSTKMLREVPKIGRPIESIRLGMLTAEAFEIVGEIAKQTGVRRLAFETRALPNEMVEKMAGWEQRVQFDELTVSPHHRVGAEWSAAWLSWLLAFERLAPVKRFGMGDDRNRIVVGRGKRGLEVEIFANQDWLVGRILSAKLPSPITRLIVRGSPASWFPPSNEIKRKLKKLPKGVVELCDGWALI